MNKSRLFTAAFLNSFIFYSLFILNNAKFSDATVDFTNVDCYSPDTSIVYFENCFLKSVNRTYKYFSMRLKWCKNDPVSNITVTLALLKRANGYKPFLYNVTFNACQYLRSRSNPVVKYFHSWFEAYSNMNHTCPYALDDIVVDKLPVSHINRLVTNVLPIPTGDFLFHSTWCIYNKKVAIVKVRLKIF